MTFSIIAYAPDEQAWGVAVASKFLAVGAVVPWAKAGDGAVATQALAKVSFGPDGLMLLAEGKSAPQTLQILLENDAGADHRQIGLVDAQGNVAAHTGSQCFDWAGHKTGEHFTCQGNVLVSEAIVNAMADAFTAANGELAQRLLAALIAGDAAGGDKRGKQSAALMVVRPNGGYGGDTDRYLDLRVDDDNEPVKKLKQLVSSHQIFFGTAQPDDLIAITPEIAVELQTMLTAQGYFAGQPNGEWDEMSKQAFWAFVGNENLEERWNMAGDTNKIDRIALNYLRERFK